jgi:hypothetical protein
LIAASCARDPSFILQEQSRIKEDWIKSAWAQNSQVTSNIDVIGMQGYCRSLVFAALIEHANVIQQAKTSKPYITHLPEPERSLV